jgi:hypothetical protein
VLPPYILDGHMHVDGGTTYTLPGKLMRERCPGTLIAVDISTEREYLISEYARERVAAWVRGRALLTSIKAKTSPDCIELSDENAASTMAGGAPQRIQSWRRLRIR